MFRKIKFWKTGTASGSKQGPQPDGQSCAPFAYGRGRFRFQSVPAGRPEKGQASGNTLLFHLKKFVWEMCCMGRSSLSYT